MAITLPKPAFTDLVPVTYTVTGSGGVSAGGSGPEEFNVEVSTGGLSAGGSAYVETWPYEHDATVGSSVGGSSAVTQTFAEVSTGGESAGGSSAVEFNVEVSTGGLSAGGSAAVIMIIPYIWSSGGGVSAGGSSLVATDPEYGDPAVTVGGSAVVTLVLQTSYEIEAPVGGLIAGGDAPLDWNINVVPTGGAVLAGEATVDHLYVLHDEVTPEGGFEVGGDPPIQEAIPITPTGGAVLGGEATVDEVVMLNAVLTGDGGVSAGGEAAVETISVLLEVLTSTAGTSVGGEAVDVITSIHETGGGVALGGTAAVEQVFSPTISGGTVLGGAALSTLAYIPEASGGLSAGGSSTIIDCYPLYAPSGGIQFYGSATVAFGTDSSPVTTENPYGDPFPGWAVNMESGAVSRYATLPANSMAQLGGVTYVANAGGIYALTADNDEGRDIHASITFPTTDFMRSKSKRMEDAYIGVRTRGRMRLKVSTNEKEPRYYLISPTSTTVKGTRVDIGKGLYGRYWAMRLENVLGADFELESVEFLPVESKVRHGG